MSEDKRETLLFKYSPVRSIGLGLACGAVAGFWSQVAGYVRISAEAVAACWIGAALFSVIGLFFLALAFRRGIAVEFSGKGIVHARRGWPPIAWTDISSITVRKVGISEFLIIYPASTMDLRIPRGPDGTASFSFLGLKPGLSKALEYIAQHHPELIG